MFLAWTSSQYTKSVPCVHVQLKKLNLQKNCIDGPLPTALAECKALEDLNLSNNLIAGPLEHVQWGNLCNLEHLVLANNKVLLHLLKWMTRDGNGQEF